jgi:hypothetical protein
MPDEVMTAVKNILDRQPSASSSEEKTAELEEGETQSTTTTKKIPPTINEYGQLVSAEGNILSRFDLVAELWQYPATVLDATNPEYDDVIHADAGILKRLPAEEIIVPSKSITEDLERLKHPVMQINRNPYILHQQVQRLTSFFAPEYLYHVQMEMKRLAAMQAQAQAQMKAQMQAQAHVRAAQAKMQASQARAQAQARAQMIRAAQNGSMRRTAESGVIAARPVKRPASDNPDQPKRKRGRPRKKKVEYSDNDSDY